MAERYRSNRIDNPADALAEVINTYTKMKQAETKLKSQLLLERLKRQEGFADYIAKQQFSDEMSRSRQMDMTDYRLGRAAQQKSQYDPATMEEGMIPNYIGETGEPRMDPRGFMTSPQAKSAMPAPSSANFKKFRLGILQRADIMSKQGKMPPLSETQRTELQNLTKELYGAKEEKVDEDEDSELTY